VQGMHGKRLPVDVELETSQYTMTLFEFQARRGMANCDSETLYWSGPRLSLYLPSYGWHDCAFAPKTQRPVSLTPVGKRLSIRLSRPSAWTHGWAILAPYIDCLGIKSVRVGVIQVLCRGKAA